jgi:hypothetical protein
MALKGVREGLAGRLEGPSSFDGVSIFADYTTDPDDWRDYMKLWVEAEQSG